MSAALRFYDYNLGYCLYELSSTGLASVLIPFFVYNTLLYLLIGSADRLEQILKSTAADTRCAPSRRRTQHRHQRNSGGPSQRGPDPHRPGQDGHPGTDVGEAGDG